ncbi:MAG: hypothetical protein Q4F39_00645 [Bacteroidia bacterium]|nr:hypothetical protein [Bacteroidia bacterium]
MIEFKTIKPAERQTYVPAEVKVIDITSQGIICTSGGSYNDPFGGGSESI